ncbi:amidase [Coniochaeta ligniaria NRRL 30616]|uniref:Amidase n=1 Tax=Coniochaeta ligniaria NRRL 30616 TaxID=1408157 RepID=A0A1J7JSQ5_9PEZI|nr:amidase [Coniochaeta ligniaria NRRL 30616]
MNRHVSILPLILLYVAVPYFSNALSTTMRTPIQLLKHQHQQTTTSWQAIVAEKRLRDLAKIPDEWQLAKRQHSIVDDFIHHLLDAKSRSLTNLDVPVLMEKTADASLTAFSLTTAVCKRAVYAHQLQAKALDEFGRTHKHPQGPLHGLPVPMKDQLHVKAFGGNKSSELKCRAESELVRKLESLRAIVTAKSTLVQSLWYSETNNNILGYNWNLRNQRLSSGGSSGGEGVLQALRGSAFGFGSDIGGFVSMPAAFNGVFSIKPSVGRVPFLGTPKSSPGQTNIQTVGMLGHCVASLRHVFEAIPAGDVLAKLSFGFMDFDGIVKSHPPILRALCMVKDALQASGHRAAITSGDRAYHVFEQLKLSGEPLIPQLNPDFLKGKAAPPKNAIEVEKAVQDLMKYRVKDQNYWLSTANQTTTGRPVDAVLLPVVPSVAMIPGKLCYPPRIGAANVVDNTTVVITFTQANQLIDKFDSSHVPVGDKPVRPSLLFTVLHPVYLLLTLEDDPAVYDGAPASVQVLGGRLQEEKLLAIGQVITDALQKHRYSTKSSDAGSAGVPFPDDL